MVVLADEMARKSFDFFAAWGGIANAAQRHRGFDRFEGEMTA
jgi:hypothetical protein